MTPADVAVVGGGPAGSAVAWHLAAAGASVVLVDDARGPWRPVGQQLSPAALPLLRDLGVADRLTAPAAAPVHEARSVWSHESAVDLRPALFSAYGPPLAVDRAALDALLRDAARRAGVRTLRAHVKAARGPGGWHLTAVSPAGRPEPVAGPAAVLVDATGAARARARRLPWHSADRLRCTVWRARPADVGRQSWSLVEAVADGWWYSAPTPGGGLTLMRVQDRTAVHAASTPPPRTAQRLADLPLPTPAAVRAVPVGCADPPWADGLVAAGDAALALDPLSSAGLHHALGLARPAAAAALGLLRRDPRTAAAYGRLVGEALARHLTVRRTVHAAAAPRYTAEPFWRRRAAGG
ncbi:FAD-dependent oxidoreductase [Streptomyces sp. NPDC050617]|uniref:NAD(P)/FAD-dependent oxidoreductase n=1 Tax=Streptomyces sp. NPDC050617 TaxID=3154628 RepID=UPI00342F2D75